MKRASRTALVKATGGEKPASNVGATVEPAVSSRRDQPRRPEDTYKRVRNRMAEGGGSGNSNSNGTLILM